MSNVSQQRGPKKSKYIVLAAIAVTAVFTIGLFAGPLRMASASVPGPAWLKVSSGSVTSLGFGDYKFVATTNGNIPHNACCPFIKSNIATGFAWANATSGRAFVAVIHPTFTDSIQRPLGWHAHIVSLEGGATKPHDFCVRSVDSAPITVITIVGSKITILADQLPPGETASSLNAVVGFTLQKDTGCPSPHLAVQISS